MRMGAHRRFTVLFEIGQTIRHLCCLAADARVHTPGQNQFLARVLGDLCRFGLAIEVKYDWVDNACGACGTVELEEDLLGNPAAVRAIHNALHRDRFRSGDGRGQSE